MGISMVVQNRVQEVLMCVKVLTTILGIIVWAFSVCMFFSQYQLQAMVAGVPLSLLIFSSNSRQDMAWPGWIASGLYLFAFWMLAGSHWEGPEPKDCSKDFDNWFQKDASAYHNGIGGQNGDNDANFLPWNLNKHGRPTVGSPSRYYGYCADEWLAAVFFMFFFFPIAAFTNLACLTFTLFEIKMPKDLDGDGMVSDVEERAAQLALEAAEERAIAKEAMAKNDAEGPRTILVQSNEEGKEEPQIEKEEEPKPGKDEITLETLETVENVEQIEGQP